KDKIFITNTNTYELIKKSEKVYTINSTVGMEAMLYDKNVSFMGRSIYSKMNNEQLKKFIHLYLIDIDFFDCRNNISKNVIDKIYSRA
ncbi:TPA: capsular biosynthesis protein, partial [Raoultella ornithinolytica]|nr:capsular biosynthesis protein [Raoultella ornithinolytica]